MVGWTCDREFMTFFAFLGPQLCCYFFASRPCKLEFQLNSTLLRCGRVSFFTAALLFFLAIFFKIYFRAVKDAVRTAAVDLACLRL